MPGRVIAAARAGELDVVASWDLVEELVDGLRHPKLARYEIGDDDVADLLVVLARVLPGVEVSVPIRDPRDAPVVEAALAGRAGAIVTGDQDLLADAELRSWLDDRGISVVTPAELLDLLG